jgi:hypothetical protein
MSVTDMANPYHMAAIEARMVEVRPDEDCRYMDPISFKYTNKPCPAAGRTACQEAGPRGMPWAGRAMGSNPSTLIRPRW